MTVYPHSVAVIDPGDATIVDDVLVGGYPTALAADGHYVYVVNNGDATVSRIEPEPRRVFDTFSLSRAIDLLAVGGHLWAANGGAPGHTPLGVGPGTILDYGPGPTLRTLRVGPSVNGERGADDPGRRRPEQLRDLGGEPGQQNGERDRRLARPDAADACADRSGRPRGSRQLDRRHRLGERARRAASSCASTGTRGASSAGSPSRVDRRGSPRPTRRSG